MRKRLFVLFAATILATSSAVAATSPLQERANQVRAGIPPAMAYYADHGTWRGMTVAKLQRYDAFLKNIVIARQTNTGFCVLTTKKPFVHFDGPAGKVRRGQCGERGAVVAFVQRPSPTPSAVTKAQNRIHAALPSIEAYAVDHNGYGGMTVPALRRYDRAIEGITIVRATRKMYCIESGSGAGRYHKNGPGSVTARGPCPPK
jgi:hypothetical protein